ncbi:hypothetical protein, partial [Nocardiopsis kunsanensis]|uniref:hypothetical protein n=1 Tax=Nocardiopsis kunsanensis TaxID=141693 RepID=UPI001874E6BF
LPHHGLGFGALRYLGTDQQRTALAGLPTPQISFNYLGRFDTGAESGSLHTGMRLNAGGEYDPREERAHLVDVVGRIEDDALVVDWSFSNLVHDRSTMAALADRYTDALRELVGFCLREDTGGATPSDFPLTHLDQTDIDHLVTPTTQDLLPLTPMQQGMLFHSLLDQGTSYLEQITLHLDGIEDP